MELKNMLDKQSSDLDDFSFSEIAIKKDIKAYPLQDLFYILRIYRWSIYFNLVLIAGAIALYFIYQNKALIFPILLICFSFMLIIFDTIRFLYQSKKVDKGIPIAYFLRKQLGLIDEVETRLARRSPVIGAIGFIGGFLSGLIIRGWSFARIMGEPVVLGVLITFSVLFYCLIRMYSFSAMEKIFSRKTTEKKANIQKVLKLLEEDEAAG